MTLTSLSRVRLAPFVALRRWESLKVAVPSMGESITEGAIQSWKKNVGDGVAVDEVVAVLDTDKISIDVTAPAAGVITAVHAAEGDTVEVGNDLFVIDTDASPSTVAKAAPAKPAAAAAPAGRAETRVPLSRMRLKIGERLKASQSEGVHLTTFQELDMSGVMQLRKQLGAEVLEKHGVKLGFMSFFIAACAKALMKYPALNSSVDGKDLLTRNYADVSVAVATPTGLVVPVIADCESKSLVQLERDLVSLAAKARAGKLTLEEMAGGTFTISNGGVYGSMMGTPVINPPQAAILGMHGITQRAVVRDGKVVARPVMFLALTYDHRVVDGKDAVCFLKDVATWLEDPINLLKDVPVADGARLPHSDRLAAA